MRTIIRSRDDFIGTHKGYQIEIERERPPVETFGGESHFYIRVFNDYGHAYDGYSPAGVATMAEAKREALYGACLKERPIPAEPDPSGPQRSEAALLEQDEHPNTPTSTHKGEDTCPKADRDTQSPAGRDQP